MNRIRKVNSGTLWLVFLVIILAGPVARPATYYVSNGGDDNNPGTEDHPWQTIQKAADMIGAGDTVYVRSGTYPEHVQPQNSGIAGSEIIFSAYPGEIATIDGSSIDLPEWAGLFDVSGHDFIQVNGFQVINSGPTIHNPGILADTCSHIMIKSNTVHHTSDSGIMIWNSHTVVVDSNEVSDACYNMYNECITAGASNDLDILNNHVHDSPKEGICVKDGSFNARVYNNIVHDTEAVGFYVDAQAVYTHDIEVYGNISYDGVEDGFAVASEVGGLLENVWVYNNIAYHNGWVGFHVSDCCIETHPMQGIYLINNTSYDNGIDWGGGIALPNPQAQNVVIRNNIVSQNLSFQLAVASEVPTGNYSVDHNLIDGYRAGEGEIYGNDYVEGDPMFRDAAHADFHIQEGSPAIDQGSAADAPASDFDGDSRPQDAGFDIGADEYTSGGFSLTLEMPSHFFHPQDACGLTATVFNAGDPLQNMPLICILDVYSQYWFWPDWTQEFGFQAVNLPAGNQVFQILQEFTWPDTGSETLNDIRFWAAVTDQQITQILGGEAGLGIWTFGFGP